MTQNIFEERALGDVNANNLDRIVHNRKQAAHRALEEAEARRRARSAPPAVAEIDGRGGLEPVRYGDWEVKGLASDF